MTENTSEADSTEVPKEKGSTSLSIRINEREYFALKILSFILRVSMGTLVQISLKKLTETYSSQIEEYSQLLQNAPFLQDQIASIRSELGLGQKN